MTRNPALYALIVLLLAGITHGLYWHWSAGQIEARVAEWRDDQQRKGFAIAYGGPVIGGYPGGFEVRFSEPRVEAPNGWRWAGPAVTGESALWTLRDAVVVHADSDNTPVPGTLIDPHGRTWSSMSMFPLLSH